MDCLLACHRSLGSLHEPLFSVYAQRRRWSPRFQSWLRLYRGLERVVSSQAEENDTLFMLPATPMAVATAPAHDQTLDGVISAVAPTDIITRAAGHRLATSVGRRVLAIVGAVGMRADGFATWKVGRCADRELLPRTR